MTQAYDFNNYEKDALTNPRDKAWDNWAKFDAIGTKVQGFIRDVFFRKGEGQFAEQRGLTLEQADGTLINVGIKHIDFVLKQTDSLRLNDPVTIVFEKEIPASVKGHSPTKQFGFYGANLPENAGQKTVAQLEAEDRKIAVAAEERANAEFDGTAPAVATPVAVETTATPASVAGGSDLPFETPTAPAPVSAAAPLAPAVATPTAPAAPVVPTAQ